MGSKTLNAINPALWLSEHETLWAEPKLHTEETYLGAVCEISYFIKEDDNVPLLRL